jgi:hypothetical protein
MSIRAEQRIEDNTYDVQLHIDGDTLAAIIKQYKWVCLAGQPVLPVTITLEPDEALALQDQLDDAAAEPRRCTESCDNYALPGDGGMCPRHAQDEDAREAYGQRAL